MATLNCFSLLMTFLPYSSLLLVLFSYFPEKSVALESHFETIEITSLLTAPDCSRHFTDPKGRAQSRLEVSHRYGPCGSPINMPSAQYILQQDQLRVQSRFKPNSNKPNSQFQDTKEANLPVQFSPGDYTIDIDIGTPGQQLTLNFDTGSGLIWTRCLDMPSSSSNNFNASASSSFSFVSQTKETYRGVFSYCFPSTPSSTGFLKLGPKDHYPDDVKFTPLITNSEYPSFYFIHIISISVGGVQLPIDQSYLDSPGTIIDSGTVITRLSKYVYTPMRDEFQKQMNVFGYQLVPDAVPLLDTCYNTSNQETITVPTISFTLNGNVTVDLNSSTTLYAIDPTLACLAFAENSDDNDLAVFGNTQQKTFEVMYDVDGGKLGFFPNGCH